MPYLTKIFLSGFNYNMKISSIKPYINFVSVENNTKLGAETRATDPKKEKREKIIKYSVAAAAAAAVIIGGLYYIGRRGGKVVKKNSITDEIPAKPDIALTPQNKSKPQTEAPSMEVVKDEPPLSSPVNQTDKVSETEKPKTKRRARRRIKETSEEKINPSAIPDDKKPFVLDKKYFDFSKIEGERKGNVVRQMENGLLKREFAADDGKNLSFYSEFDEQGKRVMDVEFREDTTIKSIRKYKNGEFSKMSFYEKDGVTLAKKFDSEEDADFFNMSFE